MSDEIKEKDEKQDEKKRDEVVYTGTVKTADGDERKVSLIQRTKPAPSYPFRWGIVATAPSIFGPRRRPLEMYDLLVVGLSAAQQKLLAYLGRRCLAEHVGLQGVPLPSWQTIAWEVGTSARDIRHARQALEEIAVLRVEETKPRRAFLSPFLLYVGALRRLDTAWDEWRETWTPSPEAWVTFWEGAPKTAQVTKAVGNDELGLAQDLLALKAKQKKEG